MSFATRMQATASRLLAKYGESVTVTVITQGAYTPNLLSPVSESNSSYTAYGHPSVYRSEELVPENVLHTDVKLLLYTTNVPTIEDLVLLNNVTYRVLNVQKIRAQGSNIVYILQLRI